MQYRKKYFAILCIAMGFFVCSPDEDKVTGPNDEDVYDYSLTDVNSSSDTYLETISPSYYQGNISLHYFGHQN